MRSAGEAAPLAASSSTGSGPYALSSSAAAVAAAGDPISHLPAGSGAASMLMAVSALARTPTQSVSEALLGQVQIAAAEEQMRRRESGAGDAPLNVGVTPSALANEQTVHFAGDDASMGVTAEGIEHSLRTAAQIGVAQTVSSSSLPSSDGASATRSAIAANLSNHPHEHNPLGRDAHPATASTAAVAGLAVAGQHGMAEQMAVHSVRGDAFGAAASEGQEASADVGMHGDAAMHGRATKRSANHLDEQQSNPVSSPLSATTAAARSSPSLSTSNTYSQKMLLSPQSALHPPPAAWRPPLSPRTEARMQVGNIAASVAVHEYIAQTLPSAKPHRQYNPNAPLDGVPSTPSTFTSVYQPS